MSLHVGLHWNMVLEAVRRAAGITNKSKIRSVLAFIAGLMIAGYGVRAFLRRDFLTYLLLKSEFVFLDYSESKIIVIIDYLALMGLFIFLAHFCAKRMRKQKKKSEAPR